MDNDSFWIATNAPEINCLVRGKITKITTADGFCPVVNQLYRNKQGLLFAAADQGLFLFESNRFKHLQFSSDGKDVGSFLHRIEAINDELMLVQVDAGGINEHSTLFLYNYKLQKIISSARAGDFGTKSADLYWVMTENGLRLIDVNELRQNKLQLRPLPFCYKSIATWVTNYVFFDRDGDLWLGSPDNFLAKCDPQGKVTVFHSEKILSEALASEIFQDREGILWINFLQNGASKLPTTNVSLYDGVFGLRNVSDMSCGHGRLIFYDAISNKLVLSDNSTRTYSVAGNVPVFGITSTTKGILAFSGPDIYKLVPGGTNILKPVKVKMDNARIQTYNTAIEDNNGNYIASGEKYLAAVIDGSVASCAPINFVVDQLAKDRSGNIWVANRGHQLMKFSVHPETPEKYLHLERQYQIPESINVRAATFDSSNTLWIGSREDGLFEATFSNDTISLLQFSTREGLNDHFISYLACDENNLWCGSPSGVDKLSFSKDNASIVNVTAPGNLFRRISKIIVRGDSVWALTGEGMIIQISAEKRKRINYTPHFFLAYLKNGRDTIQPASSYKFSHVDNNPTFYFAATSFLQETQIRYKFRLNGGSDTTWSDPSSNAFISFSNLPPGRYSLQARVSFPSARYADQAIEIPLTILPPWWETTWFRMFVVICVAAMSYVAVKAYVRRKLAKQRVILERQQAIQKERTRIATDMHDDLGAGLSRIKFLSEIVKLKQQSKQDTEEHVSRIGDYAKEMIGKMGEIVWALNEKNDSIGSLVAYTRLYAAEYLAQNGIAGNVQTPENFPDVFLTGEIRRNIFLTVKEALHNVVKHANADTVVMNVSVGNNIMITISDNGIGIDRNNIRPFSNGITNMQKRIHEIGGTLEIKNSNGTSVCIEVPIGL